MATNEFTIAQLTHAAQRNDNQVMRNGVSVYTLTPSDLRKVRRYVSRTARRIAWQADQKAQAQAVAAATEHVRTLVRQRASRVEGMNAVARAGRA